MRIILGVLLLSATLGARTAPQAGTQSPPRPEIVGSMSDVMVKMIYPTSDAIFYITTRTPASEAEWGELQAKALTLAESANLLMLPGRARDQGRWMEDARLMLDAGRAAFRAARAKDVGALDALSDQLYESCTTCHEHYRPNYGRRPAPAQNAAPAPAPIPPAPVGPNLANQPSASNPADRTGLPAVNDRRSGSAVSDRPAASQGGSGASIEGRWKLRAAEDLRADGTVARYPWGQHPVGSIVVERGACYLQIMSSDTPSFAAATPATAEQMKAALLSTYIAYSGPCTIDTAAGSVTLKVEAAWRPDYVGTEQKRFFRLEDGKLLFGPAPGSIRAGNETLTRRLTLDRVQ